jgi:exonuclease VII small subunit
MQIIRIRNIVALSSVLLLGAGCAASQPSTSDLMRDYAAEQGSQVAMQEALAKDWDKGSELINTGEQRVQQAEKDIRQAKKQLRDARRALKRGKRETARGQELKISSGNTFREHFPDNALNE